MDSSPSLYILVPFFYRYLTPHEASALQCSSKSLEKSICQEKIKAAIYKHFFTLLDSKSQSITREEPGLDICLSKPKFKQFITQNLKNISLSPDVFAIGSSETCICNYYLNHTTDEPAKKTMLKALSFFYLHQSNNLPKTALTLFQALLKCTFKDTTQKTTLIQKFYYEFVGDKRKWLPVQVFLRILVQEQQFGLAFQLAGTYSNVFGQRKVVGIVLGQLCFYGMAQKALPFIIKSRDLNPLENAKGILLYYLRQERKKEALFFISETKGKQVLYKKEPIDLYDHLFTYMIRYYLSQKRLNEAICTFSLVEEPQVVADLLDEIILYCIKMDQFEQALHFTSLFNCLSKEAASKRNVQAQMLIYHLESIHKDLDATMVIQNDCLRLVQIKHIISSHLIKSPFNFAAYCLFATDTFQTPLSCETVIYTSLIETYLKEKKYILALDLVSLIQEETCQSEYYFKLIYEYCQIRLDQKQIRQIEPAIIKIINPHLRRSIIHEFYSFKRNHEFEIKNFSQGVDYILELEGNELGRSLLHILHSCLAFERNYFDPKSKLILINRICQLLRPLKEHRMEAHDLKTKYLSQHELRSLSLMHQN